MSKEVERLQELIDQYDNIVFFGGAGVSTESGIPDFRSQDGLYNQKYDYPPETILCTSFLFIATNVKTAYAAVRTVGTGIFLSNHIRGNLGISGHNGLSDMRNLCFYITV